MFALSVQHTPESFVFQLSVSLVAINYTFLPVKIYRFLASTHNASSLGFFMHQTFVLEQSSFKHTCTVSIDSVQQTFTYFLVTCVTFVEISSTQVLLFGND